MKHSAILNGLLLAAVTCASEANATLNQGGLNWGPYYGSQMSNVIRGNDGLAVSTAMYVSAPVDGANVGAGVGRSDFLDFYCSTTATITCTESSFHYYGPLMGTVTGSTTGSGWREITLGLTGDKIDSYGYRTVYCYLPAQCKILGVWDSP